MQQLSDKQNHNFKSKLECLICIESSELLNDIVNHIVSNGESVTNPTFLSQIEIAIDVEAIEFKKQLKSKIMAIIIE